MKRAMLTAALLLPFIAFCQDTSPKKHQRKMTYGFSLGNHYSAVYANGKPISSDPGAIVSSGLGFRLGLLAQRPLTGRLSVIAMPELAFYENKFEFLYPGFGNRRFQVPAMAELAVHMAYKLSKGRSHPYAILGPSYRQPLADNASEYHQVKGGMLAIDAGIGLDAALKGFRLAPELRYSYNVNNVSNTAGVNDLHMHVISLVLCFKG